MELNYDSALKYKKLKYFVQSSSTLQSNVKNKEKPRVEAPPDLSWRDEFKPTIYVPPEGKASLERVFLERNPLCDIYWYKWPHDGYLYYLIADYEPIVIVYDDKSVHSVLTRPHWEYRPYRVSEGLTFPLEVLFKGSSHAPYAKTAESADRFDVERMDLIEKPYDTHVVNTNEIPAMYRTGVAHPSNIPRLVIKDPLVRACELYDEFKDEG